MPLSVLVQLLSPLLPQVLDLLHTFFSGSRLVQHANVLHIIFSRVLPKPLIFHGTHNYKKETKHSSSLSLLNSAMGFYI